MRSLVLPALLGLLVAPPAAAKVVTIDFDEFGNLDEVYCGERANVNYCDVNKYLYGHVGDYLLLSDYDWSASTTLTADPGTVFTPLRFAVRNAFSAVWRLRCPDCTDPYKAAYSRANEFEIYDYDYLLIEGYRDDRRVASQSLDPGGGTTVTLGTGFEDIDRLDLSLRGAYFEYAALEEDGYVYTCLLNEYCLLQLRRHRRPGDRDGRPRGARPARGSGPGARWGAAALGRRRGVEARAPRGRLRRAPTVCVWGRATGRAP